ncbi:DUF6397 family protein [Streptomyces sp. NPDC007084]|uniref:DUF6397 family protein n=1 Tax=Streptomyces sp. NPDC007084 TaxID=3154313 RepID=UPI0034571B61
MSGSTITQSATTSLSRAAHELDLRRGEFDLAVHLGCVRTVPDEGGGGRRVARPEIDRLRSEPGFPETLHERVKTVGTSEGAALMGVTTTRFTRLARLGLVVPVKWYVNRYRVVVWLYLAEELKQFAADEKNAPLMKGRTPESLRGQLDEGVDLRPRNWRGRRLGFLLRQSEDPWARAAAVASLLDPVQVAEVVKDPYERAYLNRLRPERVSTAAPGSPSARIAERIATADDPDEIAWLGADLRQTLAEAREDRPAPRPAVRATPSTPAALPGSSPAPAGPADAPADPTKAPAGSAITPGTPGTPVSTRRRGLLGWLRRRNADARLPTAP